MKNLICILLACLTFSAIAAPPDTINFSFIDTQNKNIRLSDFKGKWVIVNFYATWCPICWVEVPLLNELNKRNDIVVIGVALDYGDPSEVRDAITRHNLNYQHNVLGGKRRDVNSAFRQVGPVDFFPTSYVYDPNEKITLFIPGTINKTNLLKFIKNYKY